MSGVGCKPEVTGTIQSDAIDPDCVKTALDDMIFLRFGREDSMTRFVVGDDRSQSTLFPERLDDYLGEDNPVRAIDVFVDELDLARLALAALSRRRQEGRLIIRRRC